MAKRRRKPLNGPPPGKDAYFMTGETGSPTYHMPMPPVKSRGRLMAGNEVQLIEVGPPTVAAEDRPLVPASEEVAKLPRAAREAFAARCAARVARLRPNAATPEAAAALILAAATVGTPIRRQLLCVRRDYDRIAHLATKRAWTDDTPVPPDTFGPMWPDGLTPDWAKESPPAVGTS